MFGEECFLVLAGMGVASWLVLLDPGCFIEVCWEDYSLVIFVSAAASRGTITVRKFDYSPPP